MGSLPGWQGPKSSPTQGVTVWPSLLNSRLWPGAPFLEQGEPRTLTRTGLKNPAVDSGFWSWHTAHRRPGAGNALKVVPSRRPSTGGHSGPEWQWRATCSGPHRRWRGRREPSSRDPACSSTVPMSSQGPSKGPGTGGPSLLHPTRTWVAHRGGKGAGPASSQHAGPCCHLGRPSHLMVSPKAQPLSLRPTQSRGRGSERKEKEGLLLC